MSLDGLRAWIGEVERKLRMRSRVFLVLAVIAVGGAGAAIYLAVEAKNDSVSESDVQALQKELEARIDESATATPAPILPETRPTPPAEKGATGKGGTGTNGLGLQEPQGGAEEGSATPPSTGGGSSSPPKEKSGQTKQGGKKSLKELLEQAKKENAKAEKEQAGK